MILGKTEVYLPTENEEYMSLNQLEYFRLYLCRWRTELVDSNQKFFETLKELKVRKPDPLDQSATHSEIALDVETRCRQQRLITQIDCALNRIDDQEYGYCEVTGEEIGLNRLLALPVATMCIDVQEHYERLSNRPGILTAPCMI